MVPSRGDPESKYATSRARAVGRYADRVGSERAEELVPAWEADAQRNDLARDARGYWGEAGAWLQKRVRQIEREERGPGPGFESIPPLDLDVVPSAEEGLEEARARRKELSDALLTSGLGEDTPLFHEHL